MNTSAITHPIAMKAIEAFQAADSARWIPLFAKDVTLLDDGKRRDFKNFSTEAIKIERFTSIEEIEDNGTSIYGQYHSDVWGDFRAYFKFHFNEQGEINMLEIGQAD
jgi:hypothetical protein